MVVIYEGVKIALIINAAVLPITIILFILSLVLCSSSLFFVPILDTFDHNKHVLYLQDNKVIYNEKKLDITFDVEWIDDNHIIYSKEEDNNKSYYLLDSNENTSLLYSSNDLDEYGVIYKNSILYFISSDNTYNKYDNNTLTKIDKDEYYLIRDGNKYKVDINYKNDSNDIDSLSVKDNINNVNIIIDKDLLITNRLIKKLGEYSEINILNYYVFNDELLIQIKSGDSYYYLLKYNNGAIYYYDYEYFYNNITVRCLFINELKQPLQKYVEVGKLIW